MDHLLTEARNPASTNLDELTAPQLVRLMCAEDANVIPAVAEQADRIAQAIEAIAGRLRAGGRLIYVGAGTSGRLGVLDATECPPTFNSPPGQVVGVIAGGYKALTQAVEGAEDHPEFGEQDLAALPLDAKDVVVGIATSGRTPYVLGAAAFARQRGAYAIGLTCNPDSELSALVDLSLTVPVGAEVLSGSTRLKAGTATKLVLNMLSTGAMVRLGKTFGNLMVDLRATNSKLRARTNRIVRQLSGATVEEADALLQQCGGELKTALVARLANVPPEEARARLREVGGQVRRALEPHLQAATRNGPADHLRLGVDGGGTHTVALLASLDERTGERAVVGRGLAGPSNMQAVGLASATRALDQAVSGAFAAAGMERMPVAAVCLGLAGADRLEDQCLVRSWAQRANLASRVEIVSDAALVLAAGTPAGWGLAVISGTGSIAWARTPDGRLARAGGWGHLFGDEGSAYAIAIAGLKAVGRAADGLGPMTTLTARFLNRLSLEQPQQLIPAVYRGGWDRAALAGLTPLVLEAAAEDAVAGQVVGEAAQALAATATAAARRLGLDRDPVPVALAGSVLINNESFREQFLAALRSAGIRPGPVAEVTEPAEGAVLLAAKQGQGLSGGS